MSLCNFTDSTLSRLERRLSIVTRFKTFIAQRIRAWRNTSVNLSRTPDHRRRFGIFPAKVTILSAKERMFVNGTRLAVLISLALSTSLSWAQAVVSSSEPADILVNLIKINTSNPPGNETRAAEYIKGVLAAEKNRLHKVLNDAGIRLGGVVSDIHGASAQAMIEGLIAGQPLTVLVGYARGRMKAQCPELLQALDEPLSERHRLLLDELHRHIRFLEQHLHRLEQQLLAGVAPYQRQWQLLQTIPGIDGIIAVPIRIIYRIRHA